MRIRSGHIVVLVGAFILASVAVVLAVGGGTQAAPNTDADSLASLPAAGEDQNRLPAIEVETTEKDLGVVSNTEHTIRPFVVKNTGTAPLHIREVKTSCACTLGKIPPDGLTIPAGGQGTFDIEIDPFRIPGFEARRVLTVYSNDPLKPQVEIGVTSHVEPEFSVTPEFPDFGEVQKGAEPTLTVLLRQVRDEPVEVTGLDTFGLIKHDAKEAADATAAAAHFRLGVTRRPEDQWATPGKAEYELSIGLTKDAPAGSLEGKKVFLGTNVKRLAAMPLFLKGKIVAPYTLAPAPPQKLNIKGDKATGTYQAGYAVVTAQGSVTIEDIAPQSPHVLATAEPGATPNDARLRITISPDAPAGPIETDVSFTVSTASGKFPEHVGVRSYGIGNPAAAPK